MASRFKLLTQEPDQMGSVVGSFAKWMQEQELGTSSATTWPGCNGLGLKFRWMVDGLQGMCCS